MAEKVVRIEAHNNFKGYRGSLNEYDGIINKMEQSVNQNHRNPKASPLYEGVKSMEITPKEYTDQRISSLEKSIDQRFDSNEKLISEKIDHLHTKFEKTLDSKLGTLKDSIFAEQSTQTQNNRSNMIGIIGVATAIIVGAITILLTGISIAIAIYL